MKKFEFPLNPLLKYRKETELRLRKDLFLAYSQLQYLQEKMKELDQDYQQILGLMRNQRTNRLVAQDTILTNTYFRLLNHRIRAQQEEIFQAQRKVENRRQAVITAMQKRKIVENLEEKQYAAWDYEYQEQEKAFFDELATIRYMRDKLKKET